MNVIIPTVVCVAARACVMRHNHFMSDKEDDIIYDIKVCCCGKIVAFLFLFLFWFSIRL